MQFSILKSKNIGLILIILLILFSLQPLASADDHISGPETIPEFKVGQDQELKQGKSAELTYTVKNRYEKKMTDIHLIIGIYELVQGTSLTPINQVNYIPIIVEIGSSEIALSWYELLPGTSHSESINISTYKDTPAGTYFVRMMLVFYYDGVQYTMRSRGHFTSEQWHKAEQTATPSDTSGVNLTTLGITGLLPDSAFDVVEYDEKEDENYDWIIWPAVIILIIAVAIGFFYYRKRIENEDEDE